MAVNVKHVGLPETVLKAIKYLALDIEPTDQIALASLVLILFTEGDETDGC